jgi:hypothetical protein
LFKFIDGAFLGAFMLSLSLAPQNAATPPAKQKDNNNLF